MVYPNRYAPVGDSECEDCCPDEGCDIFDDDFDRSNSSNLGSDWTEVTGGWEIDTNRLECTSDGICLCNEAHPDDETYQKVSVDIYITASHTSFSIILDYVDSNNYHEVALEVYLDDEAEPPEGTCNLRFYVMDEGSKTQLGDTVEPSGDGMSGWVTFNACFSADAGTGTGDDSIVAWLSEQGTGTSVDSTAHARSTTAQGGYKAGVAAGLIDMTQCYFDNFNYDKLYSATNDHCPGCLGGEIETCDNCDGGSMPDEMLLVLAGAANGDCSSCGDADGGYTVSVTACTGAHNVGNICGHPTTCPGDWWSYGMYKIGSDYILRAVYMAQNNPCNLDAFDYTFEKNFGTTPPDCLAFNGEELSYVSCTGPAPCGGALDPCDFTGATVKIWSLY